MDVLERYYFKLCLRIKLNKRNLFIHTSFMYFHSGQLNQNRRITDQYNKINKRKGGKHCICRIEKTVTVKIYEKFS